MIIPLTLSPLAIIAAMLRNSRLFPRRSSMVAQNKEAGSVDAVPDLRSKDDRPNPSNSAAEQAQALNEAHLKSVAVILASGKRTALEALQAVERGQTVDDVLSHYETRLRRLGASS